jgi:hypothetical protein
MELQKTYYFNKKERHGINSDGGYVIATLDHALPNHKYDCYISCGVSNEESFTRDFLAKYNIPIQHCYAFDGTIHDYPWHYTPNIKFFKKNIGPQDTETELNLHSLLRKYKNIFLKMDIEGGEYPWIYNLPEDCLQNIRQLTIEFHGILDNEWGTKLETKLHIYKKMNKYHYIVHVHGNNYGGTYENKVPTVIELSYVRKTDVGELQLNKEISTIPGLDYPNCGIIPDSDVSFFKYP